MTSSSYKLTVYYDGLCPLCSKEIELYKKRDRGGEIHFIDINLNDFDAASEGLDPKLVHKVFHVKNDLGQVLSGLDAFGEIWKTLNIFKLLQILAQAPVSRQLMLFGYNVFAKYIRPRITKSNCEANMCGTGAVRES